MSWATTTASYAALRNKMGVNSTQFSDTAAGAALADALSEISNLYPTVSSTTLTNQSAKRLTVSGISYRRILGVEIPIDEDPRNWVGWHDEEDGVIRMPDYEPAAETVRVWYAGTWTVTSVPTEFNEDVLTAAIAVGLTEEVIKGLESYSLGGDSAWGVSLTGLIREAKADWARRRKGISQRGANRLYYFCGGAAHGKMT